MKELLEQYGDCLFAGAVLVCMLLAFSQVLLRMTGGI